MQLINTGPEPFFEDVANHMAAICRVPLALVALRAPERVWINDDAAETGLEADGTMREALRPLGLNLPAGSHAPGDLDRALAAAGKGVMRSHLSQPLVINGEEIGNLHLATGEARDWGVFERGYLARAARLVAAHFEARAAIAERDARIALEHKLAEAGELHRAVIGAMVEGVAVLAADGRVLSGNFAARAILGLSPDVTVEHLGQPNLKLCNSEGRPLALADYPAFKAMRTGAPQFGVCGVQRPSGEWRWIDVKAIPLQQTGGPDGWPVVVTFSDITDNRRQIEQLDAARRDAEAANRAKSAFVANMSHEIRTPLNGVIGMAQVLGGTDLDEGQRSYVQTIVDSGRTLMALLNDILDLSKIEAGKLDIVPAETDLEALLRAAITLWRPRAEEKGLDLRLMLDTDGPAQLTFDGVRVQQCLSNLISNAIKFTEAGSVTVSSRVRQRNGVFEVAIDVADTGAGIDEATLARLFKPFVQADDTTSRRHGGSGLGLSITRRLAEMMGGTATARSEPGRGAVFTLTFRAEPGSGAVAETASPVPQGWGEPLRVLLVDDHVVNRMVARLLLRSLGAEIVEATNGAEALAQLDQDRFDLVLADVHMPVMGGPEMVTRLRAGASINAHAPVIALTADAMDGDHDRFLAMGMDGYVSKPLAEGELLAEVTRVLGLTTRVGAVA